MTDADLSTGPILSTLSTPVGAQDERMGFLSEQRMVRPVFRSWWVEQSPPTYTLASRIEVLFIGEWVCRIAKTD